MEAERKKGVDFFYFFTFLLRRRILRGQIEVERRLTLEEELIRIGSTGV